jgi:hypothetical protein
MYAIGQCIRIRVGLRALRRPILSAQVVGNPDLVSVAFEQRVLYWRASCWEQQSYYLSWSVSENQGTAPRGVFLRGLLGLHGSVMGQAQVAARGPFVLLDR